MRSKIYAKVGNRKGRPGYRTSSTFRARKNLKVLKIKSKGYNMEIPYQRLYSTYTARKMY